MPLLVLDELWGAADAEPFDVLSPQSRTLITTRDSTLLTALSAENVELEVLPEAPALKLLALWSRQVQEALPETARLVAKEYGYLPLALSLAGARACRTARRGRMYGRLWSGAASSSSIIPAAASSSRCACVAALPENEAQRYTELAVYPEDTLVPMASVCRLWRHTGGLEDFQSRDLLHRLQRKALLYLSNAEEATHLSFHDLQHDFLRLNIESLAATHSDLIEAYRAACPGRLGQWPERWLFLPVPALPSGRRRSAR